MGFQVRGWARVYSLISTNAMAFGSSAARSIEGHASRLQG